MARFDGILSDTRKYGFTLVTVLLTANALVTTSNPVMDRTAASIVVMALLLVLYLIESYYNALLRATASRAIALEGNHDHITGRMSVVASRPQVKFLVSAVYVLFVVVAAGIAFVADLTVTPVAGWGLVALSVFALIVLGAMLGVHQSSLSASVINVMRTWVGLRVNPPA